MISYLLSVHPLPLSQILNGLKTEEIRKVAIETPCIMFGYCTMGKPELYKSCQNGPFYTIQTSSRYDYPDKLNGLVVCKFVVDKVTKLEYDNKPDYFGEVDGDPLFDETEICKAACLDNLELSEYLNDGCTVGYAWHISQLEVFERPMELKEFYVRTYLGNETIKYQYRDSKPEEDTLHEIYLKPLTKAPQSYQAVEVRK